jgi:hypothetical protein
VLVATAEPAAGRPEASENKDCLAATWLDMVRRVRALSIQSSALLLACPNSCKLL